MSDKVQLKRCPPNNRMKPHKMRTTAEWLAINRRVSTWTGGVWNGSRRQCPVCFSMFQPVHPHRITNHFCSKSCCRVANQAARYARRLQA